MTKKEIQPSEHEPDAQETAEDEEGERLSEKIPERVSGAGKTPLGDTDQHSDAPGPDGLG